MKMTKDVHWLDQQIAARFLKAAQVKGIEPLTIPQMLLLDAASALPGCNQTQLVHATGIDRSTTAEMIPRLIAAKLMTRERDVKLDARQYLVNVTPNGSVVYTEQRTILRAVEKTLAKEAKALAVGW